MYHLWPEGEYPDILLVHTTKGMQVSMDTQLLCSMEHSQRLTAPHTNQMSGSKSPTWRKMSVTSHQEKVSHYCYIHIRCIASVHDYVLYYSCMLYDVYTCLVVQRSHYTHIVTTHHPHTITIITTYPKREQETQSQPQPPHRKADTEKITLF